MDRRRSPLENALQPLVTGLVEVSPSLWKHTKRIGKYWLMLPFDCSKILFDIATGRYEYVTDEKEEADRRNDEASSWRWECLCNNLERNIDILKDDLRYWQNQI